MVRHLTSVCYSALVSESQTQISLCHNLLLGCQIILRFVQSTIISRFGTLVLHINAEKPLRLDFQNLYCLFFPDFMFENLESTCHLTSFHDEFIVAPSGWKLVGGNLPILEVGVTSHVQIRHIVLGCLASFSLFIMFNLCACNVCENRRTITKI